MYRPIQHLNYQIHQSIKNDPEVRQRYADTIAYGLCGGNEKNIATALDLIRSAGGHLHDELVRELLARAEIVELAADSYKRLSSNDRKWAALHMSMEAL